VFKSLGAAALGAAGFARFSGAAGATPSCRGAGHPCEGNQTCCDGLVCVVSGPGAAHRCTPCPAGQIACGGVCINACVASDQCHDAGVCDPAAQACTNPPKADGSACSDGDACTQTDTCQAGVCTGGNPVVCAAQDQCHVAGVCNPSDGSCSNPNATDGTSCNDGNACTTGDVCVAGICTGTPVDCPAPTACQISVTCDPSSGSCVAVNQPDGTLCGADNACSHDICQAGACVANVPKPLGTACNDQNSCTQTDACDGAGACVGSALVTCPPTDACHGQGVCDTTTGACGANPQLPGTCFVDGVCYQAGQANPDNPCQVCRPGQNPTGFSNGPDGVACDDHNACTTNDVCSGGACIGSPVTCPPPSQCHQPGVCDPASGFCTYADSSTGTSCDDGSACTTGDACNAGVCISGPGCAAPAICSNDSCCTPDFAFPTDAAPCCSGVVDIVTGFCEHQPLGGPCFADYNCGFAIEPACCNGFCRDLSTDPLNCGACGQAIPFGAVCFQGERVCQVPAQDFCPNPDRCVNLQVDLNNCGQCGRSVPAGGICDFGNPTCTPGFHNDNGVCCASGLSNCGGSCVDFTVDLNNCGGCGVQVPAGGICSFGSPICLAGSHNDNGRCCINTERNCGGCCTIFAGAVCPC
jgi:hypothetical protein